MYFKTYKRCLHTSSVFNPCVKKYIFIFSEHMKSTIRRFNVYLIIRKCSRQTNQSNFFLCRLNVSKIQELEYLLASLQVNLMLIAQ